jgi:aldehyde dehydrogenase (NAD+)
MDVQKELRAVGLDPTSLAEPSANREEPSAHREEGDLVARSPIDGSTTAKLRSHSPGDVDAAIGRAHGAHLAWRLTPAPRRGELVRVFGEELRKDKDALAALVTIEAGKIVAEARGEVQEMIDICDFACGLSRQLYGLTIASERPGHAMRETWHPLGVVGVISAFNFPVAVWAWNFTLAIVCGDSVVWKPSEKTPLTALACQAIFERAAKRFAEGGTPAPKGLSEVIVGDAKASERMVDDRRVQLVSATGSTRMGRAVYPRVAQRFGRCLLELGGNNAMIVTPTADLELATRAILFSAVGTCGQRCTSLRRLVVHESLHGDLVTKVERAYSQVKIGDPREAARWSDRSSTRDRTRRCRARSRARRTRAARSSAANVSRSRARRAAST